MLGFCNCCLNSAQCSSGISDRLGVRVENNKMPHCRELLRTVAVLAVMLCLVSAVQADRLLTVGLAGGIHIENHLF